MRKIWIGLLLLLIVGVGGGALWWNLGIEEEIPTVNTVTIKPGTLDQEIFTTGKVTSRGREEIRSLVSGKIAKVNVKEGDQVKSGQVLIEMDTTLADAQVEQAEASVAAAQASLRLAKENLKISRAPIPEIPAPQVIEGTEFNKDNLIQQNGPEIAPEIAPEVAPEVAPENASENDPNLEVFLRQKPLPTIDVPMPNHMPLSRSNNKKTYVIQAETQVNQAEAALKQAQAVLKVAKAQRNQLILKAQIDGTVTEVNVRKGSLVPTQNPLVVVSNLKELKIEAELNETDGGKVKKGQQVTMSSMALGTKVLEGVVEKVGLEALIRNVYQAPGSTVVKVEIDPIETTTVLKPGYTVDVKIILASKKGVLAVPYEALFQEGNKTYVYIVNQEKLVRTEVIPGAANDTKQEILSGINEGDKVVLNPSASFYEGMEVKVVAD